MLNDRAVIGATHQPAAQFTHALGYARAARQGLEVFLTDPDVPMDTNHIERALRVIPMGRKKIGTSAGPK